MKIRANYKHNQPTVRAANLALEKFRAAKMHLSPIDNEDVIDMLAKLATAALDSLSRVAECERAVFYKVYDLADVQEHARKGVICRSE